MSLWVYFTLISLNKPHMNDFYIMNKRKMSYLSIFDSCFCCSRCFFFFFSLASWSDDTLETLTKAVHLLCRTGRSVNGRFDTGRPTASWHHLIIAFYSKLIMSSYSKEVVFISKALHPLYRERCHKQTHHFPCWVVIKLPLFIKCN